MTAGNCRQLLTDGSHCVLPAGHYQSEPDDDHENGYGVSLMAAGREHTQPPTLRERRAASSEARNAAVRQLKKAHPDEYRRLYEEEALKRGVTPASAARTQRIARLRAELSRLEGDPS